MKNMFRAYLFIPWFFLISFLPQGLADENGGSSALQSQLDEIKTRLESVEKQQQEISAKDDQIIEALDRLRVWVHRK